MASAGQDRQKKTRASRHRRWLRAAGIVVGAVAVLIAVGSLVVANNTQVVVGLFQGYKTQNSFEPKAQSTTQVRDNGIVYVNDISYADQYPNSYLDISYPDGNFEADRPTIVFFHGGGFFGGDKVLGDPLAAGEPSNLVYDRLIEQGYNFVNVNYALVPEHRFPAPVRQMDQALSFLRDNAAEHHLDMDNVIVIGSSAGAIMAAQYGAMLSNPDYASAIDIQPSIPLDSVRGIIIDDAPLDYDHFGIATKILIGNYLDGTIHPSEQLKDVYDPTAWVAPDYPKTFLMGSNYTGDGYAYDMERLSEALDAREVQHDFFYETRADGSEANHGLLGGLPSGDSIAVDAFTRMSTFLAGTQR